MNKNSELQDVRIGKVRIKGFKRFQRALTVDLNDRNNVLVGDNGAGKSTILEAIHLALTGSFRGAPVGRALSPYLFNANDVARFIETSGTPSCALPAIEIEVYFDGAAKGLLLDFDGAINSEHARETGFTFKIEPAKEYAEDLAAKVRSEHFDSLPIEYYAASWMTFSSAPTFPRKLPMRSAFINPGGEWGSMRADERAVRSIVECLDPEICRDIAGDVRSSRNFLAGATSLTMANSAFDGIEALGGGSVVLSAKQCSGDSWIKDLTVQAGEVPFAHMGSGSQCLMQAQVALRKQPQAKKPMVVLYEEPENHLSHVHLRKLMETVLAATGRQTVFSTHSSYVANKLDLGNLLLVSPEDGRCTRFADLDKSTRDYFEKLAGFDTLRIVLADRSILVEGPSDELIVQKLYRDSHGGRLPIDDGIDVICVNGLSFKRFLDLAKLVRKRVAVVTDNDGKPEAITEKYVGYSEMDGIKICSPATKREGTDGDGVKSWNTLEPELSNAFGWKALASLLEHKCVSEAELIKHMESHKTDCALQLFISDEELPCPSYISDAFRWVEQ